LHSSGESLRDNALASTTHGAAGHRQPLPLLEIPGIAALTAAKLVGEITGIERFAADGKLAVHAGVAPLLGSSGNCRPRRLSRCGNRQINAAPSTESR